MRNNVIQWVGESAIQLSKLIVMRNNVIQWIGIYLLILLSEVA